MENRKKYVPVIFMQFPLKRMVLNIVFQYMLILLQKYSKIRNLKFSQHSLFIIYSWDSGHMSNIEIKLSTTIFRERDVSTPLPSPTKSSEWNWNIYLLP